MEWRIVVDDPKKYEPSNFVYSSTSLFFFFFRSFYFLSFPSLPFSSLFFSLFFPFLFFLFSFIFWTTSGAYWSSQVRDQTGATAVGLCHSHSNSGSCSKTGSLTYWVRLGIKSVSCVLTHWATIRTLTLLFFWSSCYCDIIVFHKKYIYIYLNFILFFCHRALETLGISLFEIENLAFDK